MPFPFNGVRPGGALAKPSAQRHNATLRGARGHRFANHFMGGGVMLPSVRGPKAGGGDRQVTFRITSDISSQTGRYGGKSITPGPAVETGNLAEADLGTLASAEDLVCWHVPEIKIGAAKHLLIADGAHYVGTIAGTTSDGKRIVKFSAMPVGETSSPTTVPSGGAVEGDETALTDTWSRASDGTPLDIWMVSRVVYNHAGDKKLYSYMRKFSYDATGLLIAISAETRVEVDPASTC